MKFDFLVIAESATAHDGLLYVHGGGTTRIHAPLMPWTHPQLALAMRFKLDEADVGRTYALGLSVRAPSEDFVLPHATFPVDVKQPETVEGEDAYFTAALTVSPLTFRQYGRHTVDLDLDGQLVHRVAVAVVSPPADDA